MEELSKLLFGAIGGGIAATIFKIVEAKLDARRKEKESAHATLKKYAKPLWLAAHALELRLAHLTDSTHESLKQIPQPGNPIDWYTKYGYYATSTAYLLSSVASWLGLFQRDVVFLEFGEESRTQAFFRLTENFQATLSQRPSVLWYQYIDGIGSELVDESASRPMTFSAFCRRLHRDETFRLFYDQLFQFLKGAAADGEYREVLAKTQSRLASIKAFLTQAGVVPRLEAEVEPGI